MSESTQLMLTVECDDVAQEPLAVALAAFDVACILIVPAEWRPVSGDEPPKPDHITRIDPDLCATLVATAQARAVAAVVANEAVTAQTCHADGCHLDASETPRERFAAAKTLLGRDAIVGALPGPSRHTAMSLAEAGADYVGFVVTSDTADLGVEMVAWWAEIFETPIVAFANGDLAACERALKAGPPDFLAVSVDADLAAVAALIKEHGELSTADKK